MFALSLLGSLASFLFNLLFLGKRFGSGLCCLLASSSLGLFACVGSCLSQTRPRRRCGATSKEIPATETRISFLSGNSVEARCTDLDPDLVLTTVPPTALPTIGLVVTGSPSPKEFEPEMTPVIDPSRACFHFEIVAANKMSKKPDHLCRKAELNLRTPLGAEA